MPGRCHIGNLARFLLALMIGACWTLLSGPSWAQTPDVPQAPALTAQPPAAALPSSPATGAQVPPKAKDQAAQPGGPILPPGVAATTAAPEKPAQPDVVILGALDKITAKVTDIEAVQDKPVWFGTLQITMRTCKSNPPEDRPENAAFLEIVDYLNKAQPKPVFTGWMFSSSPSLSAMDHPIYDVWVISCKISSGPVSTGSK